MSEEKDIDRMMTPRQVAAVFSVNPKTVTRWASTGLLGSIRTPGGHRRFHSREVFALLEEGGEAGPPLAE